MTNRGMLVAADFKACEKLGKVPVAIVKGLSEGQGRRLRDRLKEMTNGGMKESQ